MPLVATFALTAVLFCLLFPRWELRALSGAEVTYYAASIRWFPGMLVAILAATGIGAAMSLIRNPHDPAQRAIGGLIAALACFGATFLLARVPEEYRTLPFAASGWVHIASGAAFVAAVAMAAPLASVLHGRILSDEDRAGEGHPDLMELDESGPPADR